MAEKKSISVAVVNQKGEEVGKVNLNASVFGIEPNEQVMFDAVQVYLSNRRQATAKTKVRHEVSGGGKKPFRQKGTGRARAGTTRSPIWVGGGTVFGPDGNQSYKLSQNKSEHALALRSALSQKAAAKKIIIVDEIKAEKTKEVVAALKAIKADKKVLIVSEMEDKYVKASRNIAGVKNVKANNVSVYDLLNHSSLVLTKDVVKVIEEALA